jgi:WD40 repeat protein
MSDSPPDPQQDYSSDPLRSASKFTQTVQALLAIVGVITGVASALNANARALGAGVAIVLGSVAWFAFSRWRQRHRPTVRAIASSSKASGAFLRGLLPFQRGDQLLGRDGELASLLTRVQAEEYRFGYLSAEAGCGKTSLIRAGLLPRLEESGWPVVHVPRSGPDPRGEIVKTLRRVLDLPEDRDAPLRELVSAGMQGRKNARLMIVCDQFEEFFIAQRTRAGREPFIREVGECVNDRELPVAFLLALRKEFAEDLQDFGRVIDQPMDRRFAERLQNWEPETALGFLQTASAHDRVPFAEALMTAVVRDLTRAGEVRPVELQLVATRLKEERVYDVTRYAGCGRAAGLLAAFIKDVIEPNGAATAELQRQVTRHLLRSLCADNRDAKRPRGVSFDDLAQYVAAGLDIAGQGSLVTGPGELRNTVCQVLRRCVDSYLVILEDENLYNLSHDYIVRPIRDATADLETIEEQANRLADRYVEDGKRNSRLVLSLGHYRFLTRYLSPQRRLDPAFHSLLVRSRRRFAMIGGGSIVLLLALLTLVLPPRESIRITKTVVSDGQWYTSQNGKLAVLVADDGTAYAWSVDDPWMTRKALGKLLRVHISEDSRYVLGLGVDTSSVYLWRVEHGQYRGGQVPIKARLNNATVENIWGGFTRGGERAFIISGSGDLYLWHTDEVLVDIHPWMRLGKLSYSNWPSLAFDSTGNWMAVGHGRANTHITDSSTVILADTSDVYLLSTRERPKEVVPTITLEGRMHQYVAPGQFSRDGKWIAVGGDDEVWVWKVGERPGDAIPLHAPGSSDGSSWSMGFSPGARFLVARRIFGNFYMWMPERRPSGQLQPLFESPQNHTDGYGAIQFSKNGKWALGTARDGNLYLWETEYPADGVKRPILKALVKRSWPDQRVWGMFNPPGSWVGAVSSDGGVYAWRIGARPEIARPLARHDLTGSAQLIWSSDGTYLYTLGGSDMHWGRRDRPLERVIRADSRVVAFRVTADRRELVIISERHVNRARRQWSLWGIPLVTLKWPVPQHRNRWKD